MRRSQRGFTLIEMLIVITIIGILAAIAVPGYQDYVRRSKMAEATSQLSELRVRMEQYYQDNRSYQAGVGACGVAMPAGGGAARYFAFACASADPQSYTITATGSAGEGMGGYTYTIDQANNRQTTAFPGAGGLPKSCWIYRKGDGC